MNYKKADEFITIAKRKISKHAKEDVLRHWFSECLPSMVGKDDWWIKEHSLGAEYTLTWNEGTCQKCGFADVLIGKTAIEYEKDLSKHSLRSHGLFQVKQYCAGLLNLGIPEEEIVGVLSDTIRWYAYNIQRNESAPHQADPNKIVLAQESFVDLFDKSKTSIDKLSLFFEKYFNRSSSKRLTAESLAADFGIDSALYKSNLTKIINVIGCAAANRPAYFNLIKALWSRSVSFIAPTVEDRFSQQSYANEFFIISIAKILCARFLQKTPTLFDEETLISICDGSFFKNKNIANFVEYDYFGWISVKPYSLMLLDFFKEADKLLTNYDFYLIGENDIFGKIIAELASKDKRRLLGQEFTSSLLAGKIVNRAYEKSENPDGTVLDMCCGSGVFLVETIKHHISRGCNSYDSLAKTAVGFDIDPLAVMLAKTNWIITMGQFLSQSSNSVFIPIYQADSLFVSTPASSIKDGCYHFQIEGFDVQIPHFLLNPRFETLFDSLFDGTYQCAMAMNSGEYLTEKELNYFADKKISESEAILTFEQTSLLKSMFCHMTDALYTLQKNGKNGLWHFVLSNSYRPGLLENCFDFVISNPPWMAMSELHQNPYIQHLKTIAKDLNIYPGGSSFLHMELSSIFAVRSVNRYLKNGGTWSFIMPSSILNGMHLDKFRRRISSGADFSLNEIWELPNDTFKNRAVVLFGTKSDGLAQKIESRYFDDTAFESYKEGQFAFVEKSNRLILAKPSAHLPKAIEQKDRYRPTQGADIFPRSALFHIFEKQPSGFWKVGKIEKTDPQFYLISDNHKFVGSDISADNFDDQYVYNCLISKMLMPFHVSKAVPFILAASKGSDGSFVALKASELITKNAATQSFFHQLHAALEMSWESYFTKGINCRNKLVIQKEGPQWLVLSSAGGSNPCAAYFRKEKNDKIIIDQTLYWTSCATEDEAIYLSGILNSKALGAVIQDLQPQGAFGRRHIHTLPFAFIPRYDPQDPEHIKVLQVTKILMDQFDAALLLNNNEKFLDPTKTTLSVSRNRLQELLASMPEFGSFDKLCFEILKKETNKTIANK